MVHPVGMVGQYKLNPVIAVLTVKLAWRKVWNAVGAVRWLSGGFGAAG